MGPDCLVPVLGNDSHGPAGVWNLHWGLHKTWRQAFQFQLPINNASSLGSRHSTYWFGCLPTVDIGLALLSEPCNK